MLLRITHFLAFDGKKSILIKKINEIFIFGELSL